MNNGLIALKFCTGVVSIEEYIWIAYGTYAKIRAIKGKYAQNKGDYLVNLNTAKYRSI